MRLKRTSPTSIKVGITLIILYFILTYEFKLLIYENTITIILTLLCLFFTYIKTYRLLLMPLCILLVYLLLASPKPVLYIAPLVLLLAGFKTNNLPIRIILLYVSLVWSFRLHILGSTHFLEETKLNLSSLSFNDLVVFILGLIFISIYILSYNNSWISEVFDYLLRITLISLLVLLCGILLIYVNPYISVLIIIGFTIIISILGLE